MTIGLRKTHLYIWLALIIIVPVIMFLSIKNLELFPSEKGTVLELQGTKKTSLATVETTLIKATVFEDHLEIILKSKLKNASSIVYEMDEKGNKLGTIGQLTTTGIYNFKIINLPKGIIIYDDLKQIEIANLSF